MSSYMMASTHGVQLPDAVQYHAFQLENCSQNMRHVKRSGTTSKRITHLPYTGD